MSYTEETQQEKNTFYTIYAKSSVFNTHAVAETGEGFAKATCAFTEYLSELTFL